MVVTTLNYTDIYEATYKLTDTIKNSPLYHTYKEYELKVMESDEIKKLLKTFHNYKEQFEEAYKYKDYHPDFAEIKKNYQRAKMNLMDNELFKTYKKYEKQLDSYLEEIEFRLKEIVNIKEKHGKINLR